MLHRSQNSNSPIIQTEQVSSTNKTCPWSTMVPSSSTFNVDSLQQQQQNVKISSPGSSRRRSTSSLDQSFTNTSTPAAASTDHRNSNKRSKAETNRKLENNPVGANFRVVIDESLVSALLECAYSDYRHHVLGYLGGTCTMDTSEKDIITCHVTNFYSSRRSLPSLLTDNIRETDTARTHALELFASLGCNLIGWYRSHFSSNIKYTPTDADIAKQQELQTQSPAAAAQVNTKSQTNAKTTKGKIKEVTNTNYNKLMYNIQKRLYICPKVLQQLASAVMVILQETKEAYAEQALDCENRKGQRIFVDSEYESFLMKFLKKSILQFDKSIDQDFRTLAIAKHHTKILIANRINEILAAWQKYVVTDEKGVVARRNIIEDLTKKLLIAQNTEMNDSSNGNNIKKPVNKNASSDTQSNYIFSSNTPIESTITTLSTPATFLPMAETKISNTIITNDDELLAQSPELASTITSHNDNHHHVCIHGEKSAMKDEKKVVGTLRKLENIEEVSETNAEEILMNSRKRAPQKSLLEKIPKVQKKNTPSSSDYLNPYEIASNFPLSKTSTVSPFHSIEESTLSAELSERLIPASSLQISVHTTAATTTTSPSSASPENLSVGLPLPQQPSISSSNDTQNRNSEKSQINLPSIQNLLELTENSSSPIMDRSENSLSIGSPSVLHRRRRHHSPFPNTNYQLPYQTNQYYPYDNSGIIARPPTTNSTNSSMGSPSLQSSSSLPQPNSSHMSPRHYIPIAPSPTNRPTIMDMDGDPNNVDCY
ncbi:4854_t:CDS:10 [Ambispora gerdemannii]|uniref:4854_t:CDS:1 n=1 Tax=Ambispora gerdemannii TaxID=144530 RepID=A0A9N9C300_9GLOM|nr:4854_t:CDS:10 [Ambispora gerdemannii]